MRRIWGPSSKRPPLVLVAVVTLCGFLVVTTGFATTAASQKEEPRKRVLINQIMTERQNVDDLDKAVGQLQQQVAEMQAAAGQSSAVQDQQNRKEDQLSIEAGTTAMEGPAVIVKVSDAPRDENEPSDLTFGTNRVQDGDLQLIVNALFASGAEAIAINDNRVSAVTPIRAAGGTIVVNYRPVSSPYRVVAIGADEEAFEKSEVATRFKQWRKQYQLGFSIDTDKNAEVPAYSGRVGIDIARPQSAQ